MIILFLCYIIWSDLLNVFNYNLYELQLSFRSGVRSVIFSLSTFSLTLRLRTSGFWILVSSSLWTLDSGLLESGICGTLDFWTLGTSEKWPRYRYSKRPLSDLWSLSLGLLNSWLLGLSVALAGSSLDLWGFCLALSLWGLSLWDTERLETWVGKWGVRACLELWSSLWLETRNSKHLVYHNN